MESFEEDGVWFLPDAQDKQIFGRLTFSPDQPIKLYLSGQLQEIEIEDRIHSYLDFPVIHGYLTSGQKVTLLECNQPFGFKTGIQTSEVYVSYILRGHHFKSFDDVALKGVSVRYTILEDWLHLPSFELQWTLNQENTQVKEFNVKQKTLEPIEIGKLSGFSIFICDEPISLQYLQLIAFFRQKYKEINLKEKKLIVIRSDTERNLKDFVDVIDIFEKLLVFASGQLTYPYEVKSFIVAIEKEVKIPDSLAMSMMMGLIEPKKVAKSDLGFEIKQFGDDIKAVEEETEKIIPINIYFRVSQTKIENNEFDREEMIFSFNEIKDKSEQILKGWELNAKKLAPIIDLYLRLTYIPRRHINDLFLSLAQAIEAFHRLAHKGVYIDKRIYKNVVIKSLVDAIPSEPSEYQLSSDSEEEEISQEEIAKFIEAMDKKLRYLNEYSLKERLEDLIIDYESCIPENFFQSEEEKNIFIRRVRDIRGDLTHLSDEKSSSVSTDELMRSIMKLRTFLEICLVKQLGFQDSDVKSLFSRRRH